MTGDILTLQQASELLKIDADTLRVLARQGKVPATKIGRQWRFDEGLLREWVRERSLRSLNSAEAGCADDSLAVRGRG